MTTTKPRISKVVDNAKSNALLLNEVDPGEVVAENREIEKTVTQDGIARVFARRFAGRLRFCHHARSWYCWSGTRWQRDETDAAFEFVRVLAREITEDGDAKDLREVRKTSFANGVERYARSDPTFAVTSAAWDVDRFLLGTPAGTVDLRTGRLRRSLPQEGITKVTAVAPATVAD
nr:hypothetical protein [Bradyrhizobium sp.]